MNGKLFLFVIKTFAVFFSLLLQKIYFNFECKMLALSTKRRTNGNNGVDWKSLQNFS